MTKDLSGLNLTLGYKVLLPDPRDNRLVSPYSCTRLSYSEDKVTVPEYGALFVFDTLDSAFDFRGPPRIVWSVLYEPSKYVLPELIPAYGSRETFENFWDFFTPNGKGQMVLVETREWIEAYLDVPLVRMPKGTRLADLVSMSHEVYSKFFHKWDRIK